MLENLKDISQMDLKVPKPEWGSELANTIIELEALRKRELKGSTPNHIFFEIKNVFQFLESIGSARIEGNHTTISEFVEKIIEEVNPKKDESLAEILNINKAIGFINEFMSDDKIIDKALLLEIHKIVVDGLNREGSKIVGDYREENVSISNAIIKPPEFIQVHEYMDSLFNFINEANDKENHLLRVAIAHHYFTVIHPFDNGNGRVVRLLTFLMLIKYGFNIKNGNILNPTAIFCNDRNIYYKMLSEADSGNIEKWCIYVLSGLKDEVSKIDRISDIKYIMKIFHNVLEDALNKKYIDKYFYNILSLIIKNKDMVISAGDLSVLDNMNSNIKRSRMIKKLKDAKMIKAVGNEKSRTYTITFGGNFLLRSLIKVLIQEKFIPESLNTK
jgi:Fic family protein